jgi:hypothetical protein
MATTYKLLDKNILSSNQTSITFTGLGSYSSNYTDLLVKLSVRSNRSGTPYEDITIQFNGSTANFTTKVIQGSGSGVSSFSSNNFIGQLDTSANTSNTFTSAEIYIPNFSSSNYKSFSADSTQEENGTTAYSNLVAGLWSNTAAITSISFVPGSANSFVTGSSFYLYGIKNS